MVGFDSSVTMPGLPRHFARIASARASIPEPLGARVGVVFLALEPLVEPAAGILPALAGERAVHFPVVPRDEALDALLALDEDRERRRLHSPHGRLVETAVLGVERGHRPRAVDADQPVGLRPAHRGVGERLQVAVGAQRLEAVADRRRRHRLQPQPLDRLLRPGVTDDVAEDELAFAPGVAGVDEPGDVLALHQPHEQLQALLVPLDRLEIEVRRDHRQVRKRPLAAFHLVGFGRRQLEQVPDRRREHALVALVVVAVPREAAERARDVVRDGGLFGDDEFLGHGSAAAAPADASVVGARGSLRARPARRQGGR